MLLAIDAGKTNLRVGSYDSTLRPVARWSIPVADLPTALHALTQHLTELRRTHDITGAGLSIFGPLSTNPNAADFGAIPESSDATWTGVNLPSLISAALHRPVFFDYDVNAGALAEATTGAAQDLSSFVYLSVGTGIGGVAFRSTLRPGHAPQLGHMFLPREPDDLAFPGTCRFHGACLQGLASGRAIAARWHTAAEELPPDHPAWDLEARYLARACANLVYTVSPEAILLGSSVSLVPGLVDRINAHLPALLNGFLEPELRTHYNNTPAVRQAALTPDSSLIGAAILARDQKGLTYPPTP